MNECVEKNDPNAAEGRMQRTEGREPYLFTYKDRKEGDLLPVTNCYDTVHIIPVRDTL